MDPAPPSAAGADVTLTRPASIDMALDDVIKGKRVRRSRHRKSSPLHEYSPGRQRSSHFDHPKRPQRPHGGPQDRVMITLVNDRYGHGTFSPANGPRYNSGQSQLHSAPDSATIKISNLFHEVSEEDIRELFSQVGPITSVKLQYDRAGRSNGVAQVTYTHRRDALLAMDRFHHVPLDGYPMQIDIAPASANNTSVSSRKRPEVLRRARSRNSDVEGKWLKREEGGKPAPSVTQLDAELDSYMMGT